MKEAVDSCKKNFPRREIVEGFFSVDGLSQMTSILDNSLLSKKDKLSRMIKWGHMNVYIFTWKHNQSNAFIIFYFETYFCFTCHFTTPPPTCKMSNLWLNGLGSQHSGAQVALSKQTSGLHSHSDGSWIRKDVFVRGWERQGCQIHPF